MVVVNEDYRNAAERVSKPKRLRQVAINAGGSRDGHGGSSVVFAGSKWILLFQHSVLTEASLKEYILRPSGRPGEAVNGKAALLTSHA